MIGLVIYGLASVIAIAALVALWLMLMHFLAVVGVIAIAALVLGALCRRLFGRAG